jgi:two-component system sensor histidine kinase PilS (NtrC family)
MSAVADSQRRRLTYVMLFRVGLVTLLLAAALVAELGAATGEEASPVVGTLFALIAATYGLSIVFALLLRTAPLGWLAAAQIASDLVLTTIVVHLTGNAESAFAFMYIMVIVAAAFVLGRGALPTALAAIALYVADGLLPAGLPLRTLIRTLMVNAVAFAATAVLATRLAGELRRAGENLASQSVLLRDLAALHEHVIRGLTSGLVTTDVDGRVLTFNQAATEIVGRAASDAIGRNIVDVMPGVAAWQRGMSDGEPLRRGEITQAVARARGVEQRTLGVSISPLSDGQGRVLGRILNFQDLTNLRRMEAQVQRAERLAAVGRLAAGVAHEIRNPLAAISGSIELLAQTAKAEPDKELMTIVLREVERLNHLITDLLEFARPRQLETQRLDVAATLSELVRVFDNDRLLQGVGVELSAPSPVWVDADPGQLRQVVWNLVRNAAEATAAAGTERPPVAIEVRARPAAPREPGWALLTVRDRGAGIAPEQRAHLFEPFFSTKQGGTGLGLATVHRIVEAHRGAIEVDCPAEGGTAFTVKLPLAEGVGVVAGEGKQLSSGGGR